MKKLVPILIVSTLLVLGCATPPSKLSTTYISPFKYKQYDCDQLGEEIDHVSHRISALYTSLNNKSNADAAQATAGAILFWPALFFLEGGDGVEAMEYSNLKGEYEAIRVAMLRKKCSVDFLPPSPEEIIQKEKDVKAEAKKENEGEVDEAYRK